MRPSCVLVVCLSLMFAPLAVAEDPTVVDPDHYSVVFENDQVRVLRITYGPGEKSVMHHHPDAVAVFLADQTAQFTLPDGTTETIEAADGEALWTPAGDHLPENLGDGPIEVILVELKGGDGGE